MYRRCGIPSTISIAVERWVLKIEIDGEWEKCTFPARQEALAAFLALSRDYTLKLQRAILFPAEAEPELRGSSGDPVFDRVPRHLRRRM